MSSYKPGLIIVAGPTASGKSAAAVELALRLNGAVISADSMQVYRGMDIGSAKITKEEMRGVPHYLIDIRDPWEEWNVFYFQKECRKALAEIYAQGKVPILCGGTGFYIQSVLYDIAFDPGDTQTFSRGSENTLKDRSGSENNGGLSVSDKTKAEAIPDQSAVPESHAAGIDLSYRQELEAIAREHGNTYLHDCLQKIDPEAAAAIHPNNVKRVIRALEYAKETGDLISRHNKEEREKAPAFNAAFFVLTMERQQLYERIERRVDLMMQQGLLEETKRLADAGCTRDMNSMQGLGYKQILEYLDGTCTLEEAVSRIKIQTRHFAKRQLTWFKREKNTIWMDRCNYPDEKALWDAMEQIAKERLSIRQDPRPTL